MSLTTLLNQNEMGTSDEHQNTGSIVGHPWRVRHCGLSMNPLHKTSDFRL